MLREAAQNSTDFLLFSWLGIVLFYFVSVRPSAGSEEPSYGTLEVSGKGFPRLLSFMALKLHNMQPGHASPWDVSLCSPESVLRSMSLINSQGIILGCPGPAQRHPALANTPLKSSPSVATWLRPAALPSPKQPGSATSSWKTLSRLFTHLHFARDIQMSLRPGFSVQLRQAEATATQRIWGCLSCTPHGS